MTWIHSRSSHFLLSFGLACLAVDSLAAQDSGAGVDREAMWWAPTADDWKRPCLITWQRTYEDALAVSRETRKPILVCVNMDGEIASEHYAGVRYRQPEIAALYEPYVCVIASVYRHNPRDHDEQGRRILCPRFGSVTCGEHIAIEPGLFERFFEDQRVAPRHIGVELDSAEMYDVFYAWDTDTIFESLRVGIASRETVPVTVIRDDRPVLERVASSDIQDRTAVEKAYQEGDQVTRRALLEAAVTHSGTAQVELLRLAVFGFDLEMSELARRALANTTAVEAVDLIGEALRVPMDTSERDALIAALTRLGESSPRARTLAAVHRGLAGRSDLIDVEAWGGALEAAGELPPSETPDAGPLVESRARAADARPQDSLARLEFAEALLGLAVDQQGVPAFASNTKASRTFERLAFEDARREALAAEALGASGWRVNAAVALSAYFLGDTAEAYRRAEAAVAGMPAEERSWSAMSALALFAEARQQAISRAWRAKTDWPPQWLSDVHAAYSVLARHPLGRDLHVASHYDFVKAVGAPGQAARILDQGLERFADSSALHDRLRGRLLAEKGVAALEETYETMLRERAGVEDGAAPTSLEWFAGYASLVAAEFHRRAGHDQEALAAYERGIAHYEHAIEQNPEGRSSADHYVALALAGRARLAYERQDLAAAHAEILASFRRKPDAAASLDGLNISPVDTAKMLRARLAELEHDDLATTLQAALDELDPELLRLPAYERDAPGAGTRGGRRQRSQGDR